MELTSGLHTLMHARIRTRTHSATRARMHARMHAHARTHAGADGRDTRCRNIQNPRGSDEEMSDILDTDTGGRMENQ